MSDNANKNACNITKLEVEAESNGKQTLELELRYWTLTTDNRLVEGAAPLKIALDLGPHEVGTQVYEVGGDPALPGDVYRLESIEAVSGDISRVTKLRIVATDRWGRAREWDTLPFTEDLPGRVDLVFDSDPYLWGLLELPAEILCGALPDEQMEYTGALTLANKSSLQLRGRMEGEAFEPFAVDHRLNDDASGVKVLPNESGDDDDTKIVFTEDCIEPGAEIRTEFQFRTIKIGRFPVRGCCDFRFVPGYSVDGTSVAPEAESATTTIEAGSFSASQSEERLFAAEGILAITVNHDSAVCWPLDGDAARDPVHARIEVRTQEGWRERYPGIAIKNLELGYELAIRDAYAWNPEYTAVTLDDAEQAIATEYFASYAGLEDEASVSLDYHWTVTKDDPQVSEEAFEVKHRVNYYYEIDLVDREIYWASGAVKVEKVS